jgi:hypothetical protein
MRNELGFQMFSGERRDVHARQHEPGV